MQLLGIPMLVVAIVASMHLNPLWCVLFFIVAQIPYSFFYTKAYVAVAARSTSSPGWRFYLGVVLIQLLLIAGLIARAWPLGIELPSAVQAEDADMASRHLFENSTWGSMYTCSEADVRLYPASAEATRIVLRTAEKALFISQVQGAAFRKMASEKVDSLVSAGKLEKFADKECPKATATYLTSGKD